MSKEDNTVLYTNENLSDTVKYIVVSTRKEFDFCSEEYEENLRSRFYMLTRRIRDSYTKKINSKVISVLDELDKSCDYCDGKGYVERGGMAMEDDFVETEPCIEPIHDDIQSIRSRYE